MPAVYPSPHTLTLVPNLPWSPNNLHIRPKEREINREVLLAVAPDREALLISNKSITELRQILKIHIGGTESHWLYRIRKRTNASLKDSNIRVSTFVHGPPANGSQETRSSSKNEIHILRRVLSASELPPFTQPKRTDRRFFSPYDYSVDVWDTIRLSTADKLISPRPLGPTHILIVHSEPEPSRILQSVTRSRRKPVRRMKSSPLSNVVEIPVNDLLFVLNAPNLSSTTPTLPPRLQKELPRVVMYVPHTETFPELVVYLHTQNQAELFRKLIPEWIRDIMHPLPAIPDTSTNSALSSNDMKTIARTPLQLLGLFIPVSTLGHGTETLAVAQYDSRPRSKYRRTVKSVAEEITKAALTSCDEQEVDPILFSVAQLNALKDNLEYLGYFEEDLWHELDVYREVLIRAVSCRAKIQGIAELEF
ncbi:hypothetical protein E4T56_gene9329 [Termitomyces sp. T112]|nr:hypothetical protein E4T56_gene9329 [Termitomyces sp. T112]